MQLESQVTDGGNHWGGEDVAQDLALHIVPAVLSKQVTLFKLMPLVVG